MPGGAKSTIISSFILFLLSLVRLNNVSAAACSSCLVSSVVKVGSTSLLALKGGNKGNLHHQHHHHHLHTDRRNNHLMVLAMNQISKKFGIIIGLQNKIVSNNNYHRNHIKNLSRIKRTRSAVTMIALRQLSTHYGCRNNLLSTQQQYRLLTSADDDSSYERNDDSDAAHDKVSENNSDSEEPSSSSSSSSSSSNDNISASMVGAIGFYKNFISPLLPPACRFLPTCSQYGVQAIEEFGPTKGAILTAWRLMRCSPFGGRGYDPPKWPPVPYTYGSY